MEYGFARHTDYIVLISLRRQIHGRIVRINQTIFIGLGFFSFLHQPIIAGFHGFYRRPRMTWKVQFRNNFDMSLIRIFQNFNKILPGIISMTEFVFGICEWARAVGWMKY